MKKESEIYFMIYSSCYILQDIKSYIKSGLLHKILICLSICNKKKLSLKKFRLFPEGNPVTSFALDKPESIFAATCAPYGNVFNFS